MATRGEAPNATVASRASIEEEQVYASLILALNIGMNCFPLPT
jgi:hypothetical protein